MYKYKYSLCLCLDMYMYTYVTEISTVHMGYFHFNITKVKYFACHMLSYC